MQEETLALRKEGIGVVLDSELPHLIGIDDDLLSTGIILYHLKVQTGPAPGLRTNLYYRVMFGSISRLFLFVFRRDGHLWDERTRPQSRTSVSLWSCRKLQV